MTVGVPLNLTRHLIGNLVNIWSAARGGGVENDIILNSMAIYFSFACSARDASSSFLNKRTDTHVSQRQFSTLILWYKQWRIVFLQRIFEEIHLDVSFHLSFSEQPRTISENEIFQHMFSRNPSPNIPIVIFLPGIFFLFGSNNSIPSSFWCFCTLRKFKVSVC